MMWQTNNVQLSPTVDHCLRATARGQCVNQGRPTQCLNPFRIWEGNGLKTAFNTPSDYYRTKYYTEYLVMPFGLVNAFSGTHKL